MNPPDSYIVDSSLFNYSRPLPPELDFDALLNGFFAKLREISYTVCDKEELTDEEKFALCWAVGVPIEFKDRKIQTRVKCGLVRIDGYWKIFFEDGDPFLLA